MIKKCSNCETVKHISDFTSEKRNKDGKRGICKVCYNSKQRLKYTPKLRVVLTKKEQLLKRSKSNKKYWKTKQGKLMLTYNNMNRRVRGYVKKHIYEGLGILNRDSFYEWSINNEHFNKLYDNWVKSEYDRKLSPSIDRINSNDGYTLGNIRWITHSENSRLGSISRHKNQDSNNGL